MLSAAVALGRPELDDTVLSRSRVLPDVVAAVAVGAVLEDEDDEEAGRGVWDESAVRAVGAGTSPCRGAVLPLAVERPDSESTVDTLVPLCSLVWLPLPPDRSAVPTLGMSLSLSVPAREGAADPGALIDPVDEAYSFPAPPAAALADAWRSPRSLIVPARDRGTTPLPAPGLAVVGVAAALALPDLLAPACTPPAEAPCAPVLAFGWGAEMDKEGHNHAG